MRYRSEFSGVKNKMRFLPTRLEASEGGCSVARRGFAFLPFFRGAFFGREKLAWLAVCVVTASLPVWSQSATSDDANSAAKTDRVNVMAEATASAPDAQSSTMNASDPRDANNSNEDGRQTKRILGIIPNFRAISSGEHLPAQSVSEKFKTATEDSFDYSSIFIPALLAAYSEETSATPEFGHGAVGYGRYFWHAAVDQTSENYMVEFIVPSVTREDTRFYTLGHGGFLKRAGYALSRAIITRSDSGNDTFNFSEVVGAGASSGLSSLYYPSRERSLANTGKEWGLDIAIDSASFVVKEFWPDVNRHLFHQGTSSRSIPVDH
jgi:hypothetical protein